MKHEQRPAKLPSLIWITIFYSRRPMVPIIARGRVSVWRFSLADETDRGSDPNSYLSQVTEGTGIRISVPSMIIGWMIGLAVLGTLVALTLHFGDIKAFLKAVYATRLSWLLPAIALQVGTYVCVAATWSRALANSRVHYNFSSLLRLSVIELFVNQALPTGGLSGTLVVVRGLAMRGVPSSVGTAALLIGAVSYYTAYLITGLVAFGLLWLHGDLTGVWLATFIAFVLMIGFVAGLILVAARSGNRALPKFVLRWSFVERLPHLMDQVRTEFTRDTRVIGEAVLLQGMVFLLDAGTLYCISHGVGAPVTYANAYSSFMLASVVATVAPVPLGLGTFEATSTAMLHLLGASTEGALAATLIVRGLTFWVPMLPGIWLLYRENRLRHRKTQTQKDGR